MSPSPPALARATSSRPGSPRPELDRLLSDLGPALRRGAGAEDARIPLATGLPGLDAQLGGGLAPGRLSEFSGPLSSGRTSLALTLLARATGAGEVVAAVDPGDHFQPSSAAAAGVHLERVLWTRPPSAALALRCCERLLQARGFAAVWLDTGLESAPWSALPGASWQRLARAGAASKTALLVSSARRVTGAHADLALELRPGEVCFEGRFSLFRGVEAQVAITRWRRGAAGPATPLELVARGP